MAFTILLEFGGVICENLLGISSECACQPAPGKNFFAICFLVVEVAKRLFQAEESEFIALEEYLALPSQRLAATLDDEDTLTTLALDPGRMFCPPT